MRKYTPICQKEKTKDEKNDKLHYHVPCGTIHVPHLRGEGGRGPFVSCCKDITRKPLLQFFPHSI